MKYLYFLIIISFFIEGCKSKNVESGYYNEFSDRFQMAYNRLTGSNFIPEFTEEFILADVTLDTENPRRFSEFSGDLSGRVIEVLSLTAQGEELNKLHQLVNKLLPYQKPDGRFGNSDLNFQQDNISGEHMALLW